MKVFKRIPIRGYLLCPFIILLSFILLQPLEEGKPKVIIRFDDYGVWCNKDWLKIEEEVIRMHEKYNVKLTYAVIPDSRYPLVRNTLTPQVYPTSMENFDCNPYPLIEGSKRVTILKESTAKGITEVALHGYFHPKGYSNISKNTEFYNVPYDVQYYKISNGKHILDSLFSTNVTTFIPPHNTYDNLTLDLLQECGFNCISAKQNNYDAPQDKRLNMRYMWFTTADVEVFKGILKDKHYSNNPIQILALHHTNFTTDGKIDNDKLASYETLLKFISDNKISNYLFSTYPNSESKNEELYRKSAYQNLLNKYGGVWASKYVNACTNIHPTSLILSLLLSLFLFIYASVWMVLEKPIKRVSIITVCILSFAWVMNFLIVFDALYSSYKTSTYSLNYILYSQMFMIQIVTLAILTPAFEISISKVKSSIQYHG